MLLLIFPARTAWMISGASIVNRIISDTYASSFPIALASSWTLENLPESIKACQRNALAMFVIIGSVKFISESVVTILSVRHNSGAPSELLFWHSHFQGFLLYSFLNSSISDFIPLVLSSNSNLSSQTTAFSTSRSKSRLYSPTSYLIPEFLPKTFDNFQGRHPGLFGKAHHKPTKFKKEFATYIGKMYPVRLCLHILPDASLHVCRWFLVGPVNECLGALSFYLNVTKQAGFRSRSCGIGRLAKIFGDSDHEN